MVGMPKTTAGAVIIAAGLLVSSCGGNRATVGSATPQSTSSITLHTKFVPKGSFFTEGALVEVSVMDSGRSLIGPETFELDSTHELGPLNSGTYQLHAAVRPCSANCGRLDAPAFSCVADVVVPDADALTLSVDARHCEISSVKA